MCVCVCVCACVRACVCVCVCVRVRARRHRIKCSPKYLTLYSLAILIVVRIGSEQLCSFSRGIFQPICKHFVCVQLFLKL